MGLTKLIPFVDDDGGETKELKERVRLLGKIEDLNEFDPDDFNELVQDSLAEMDHLLENKTAALDDELRTSVSLEDLMERHLSYRIEVGRLQNKNITFKDILSV